MRNLPDSWQLVRLSDVCTLNPRQTLAADETVSFLPMSAMPVMFGAIPQYTSCQWQTVKKGFSQFQNGDVLIARITPCFEKGKSVLIQHCPYAWGAGSSEYLVLRPSTSVIEPFFLLILVKSLRFIQQAKSQMRGAAGFKRVPKSFLISYQVYLPPYQEQRYLSSLLCVVFDQIKSIYCRLDRLEQVLTNLAASVLQASMKGQLLAFGKRTDSRFSSGEKITLKNGVIDARYGTKAKSEALEGIPVLRMGNIQGGQVDWSSLVYSSDPLVIEKFKLIKGDVLFNRTNSPKLVGKTALYQSDREAIYAAYLIRLRCDKKVLLPEFLNYHLNSPEAKYYFQKVKKDGVSQSNISKRKLLEYSFHCPSLAEQQCIVQQLDHFFLSISKIHRQIKVLRKNIQALEIDIFSMALNGALSKGWREKYQNKER